MIVEAILETSYLLEVIIGTCGSFIHIAWGMSDRVLLLGAKQPLSSKLNSGASIRSTCRPER